MGLFDMFGKGGGTLSFELEGELATCGEPFRGILVFTGGKRAQKIEGMQIWFADTQGEGSEETMLWAPTKIALTDTIQPGETKRFPFEVTVPKASQTTVNGQALKVFWIRGSLDIPKEIDPQGKAPIRLAGTLDAAVTIG